MSTPATTPRVVELGAPWAAATRAVILLHGRGAEPEAILSLARLFPLERTRVLAPAAPEGVWYPQRFLAPLAANEPWLSAALATVHGAVAAAEVQGLRREQIALAGFSQGACLALEYVARQPAPYAWVAGLSGARIGPMDTLFAPAPALRGVPVLLSCAAEDAHIPLPHVDRTAAWFQAQGAAVTRQTPAGAHHGIFPEAVEWLRAVAAP